jgi:hypothetical protein
MWRRLSEKARFGDRSSVGGGGSGGYNNNYEYDALTTSNDEEDNRSISENFRLLPLTSNGYAQLNGRNKNQQKNGGLSSNQLKKNNHQHHHRVHEEDIEVDSDAEEFNRFNYHYDTNNRNRKMLRNRDRNGPSSVENPNYSAGVIDIGPVDGSGDGSYGDGGGGRDTPNSPSGHAGMLASEEYRRRQKRRGALTNACWEAVRYLCW